jgi:hypothetical protein
MTPKVFISYSWSSQSHQDRIIHWAEMLISDGIDVVLDVYALKEGHDKYAFMERMVNDSSVSHVLLVCDKQYSEKANTRKDGVGTESQIVSKEIYEKIEQSKFIPIVCEFDDSGNPYLPIFLKSRIWIDFSSDETENKNWERLVRLIYGKPQHEKPEIGKPPSYIIENDKVPSSPAISKFNNFRQAILQNKPSLNIYRNDFLESCLKFADSLRVRERPNLESLAEKILEDCGKLKLCRDHIVDWVLLESNIHKSEDFCESLIDFLEKLRALKSRPREIGSWNDSWFEAHSVFVYETFLYIIASLLKTSSYSILHEVFTTHYLVTDVDRHSENVFESFETFYGYSQMLNSVLAKDGQQFYSPAAELMSRQADRVDLPFMSIIEAELLIILMTCIVPNTSWFPQTFYHASYNPHFPFFTRIAQHKYFAKLAIITGINDSSKLKETVKETLTKNQSERWPGFNRGDSYWKHLNMDKIDTIK